MSQQPHASHATDADVQVVAVVVAWLVAVGTVFYMLPWAVAVTRGKSNQWAIALLNLLLGWTVIGWVIALVMACGAHQQRTPAPYYGSPVGPPPGWYPSPSGPGQQYWDGSRWTEHRAP